MIFEDAFNAKERRMLCTLCNADGNCRLQARGMEDCCELVLAVQEIFRGGS